MSPTCKSHVVAAFIVPLICAKRPGTSFALRIHTLLDRIDDARLQLCGNTDCKRCHEQPLHSELGRCHHTYSWARYFDFEFEKIREHMKREDSPLGSRLSSRLTCRVTNESGVCPRRRHLSLTNLHMSHLRKSYRMHGICPSILSPKP